MSAPAPRAAWGLWGLSTQCDCGCPSLALGSLQAEGVWGHRATFQMVSSQPLAPESGPQACHPGIKSAASGPSFFSRSPPFSNPSVVGWPGAPAAHTFPLHSPPWLCLSGFRSPFQASVCLPPLQPHGASPHQLYAPSGPPATGYLSDASKLPGWTQGSKSPPGPGRVIPAGGIAQGCGWMETG